jgi:DNA primase
MPAFSRESLELLRNRVDLVEVISPHVKLQKSGANYKALCPFHDEKNPSFTIQRGDSHYHCFGCGAHGDAIQFQMQHLKMSFVEAVESLAEKFHVELEEARPGEAPKGPSKLAMKEALERASELYHVLLLHTKEGHAALEYLYARGIDLSFIRAFQIGLAPKVPFLFHKAMREFKIGEEVLKEAGLLSESKREFFFDRITIPIRDAVGSVIGFSARKYKEETFGGKYINTPETPLFKKSRVLFGLSYSRKRIAKERQALVVEGQLDALRLIHSGFDWTVAGQGTAFGQDHVKELEHLGLRKAYLAFDGDGAGQEAAVKVGHLFQKEGIEVFVLELPEKSDPDLILQEKGPEAWQKRIDESGDYLSFLVRHLSKTIDSKSPAGKNELVQTIAKRIRDWDHPLMVHESLRRLARLTQTPEALLQGAEAIPPQVLIKRSASVTFTEVDPDRILEADLLRWILLTQSEAFLKIARDNLKEEHFRSAPGKALFRKILEKGGGDLLSLAIDLEQAEAQLFLAELLQKRVNKEKAESLFLETVQKLLERRWLYQREEIKMKIYSGTCREEEVLALAAQFDALKRMRPEVKLG